MKTTILVDGCTQGSNLEGLALGGLARLPPGRVGRCEDLGSLRPVRGVHGPLGTKIEPLKTLVERVHLRTGHCWLRNLALPAWSCPPPTQIQRARLGKSARQPPRLRTGGRFARGVVIHGWHGWLSPSKPSPALVAQPSRSKLRYRVPEVRGSRWHSCAGRRSCTGAKANPGGQARSGRLCCPGQGSRRRQSQRLPWVCGQVGKVHRRCR